MDLVPQDTVNMKICGENIRNECENASFLYTVLTIPNLLAHLLGSKYVHFLEK